MTLNSDDLSITAIANGLLNAQELLKKYQQLNPDTNLNTNAKDLTEEEIRQMVGAKIRIMRKLRGLTQVALAKKLNATQSLITNIETGRRAPSLKNLIGFAQVLNVSVDWLLDVPPPIPE